MQDGSETEAPEIAGQGTAGRLTNTLPMLLLRAREAVLEPARPILRRHDLTEAQWRVLRTLDSEGEMEATRLTRAVYLRAPSLTRIVRDLCARDYVVRRPDPDDRRVVIVSIAPAGRAIVRQVHPLIRQVAGRLRDAFGPEALADLQHRLARLIDVASGTDD